MRWWNYGDLQTLPGSNEGIEGTHLPQAAKVEMSEMQPRQDAGAAQE